MISMKQHGQIMEHLHNVYHDTRDREAYFTMVRSLDTAMANEVNTDYLAEWARECEEENVKRRTIRRQAREQEEAAIQVMMRKHAPGIF